VEPAHDPPGQQAAAEEAFDRLAGVLRRSLDVDRLRGIIGLAP